MGRRLLLLVACLVSRVAGDLPLSLDRAYNYDDNYESLPPPPRGTDAAASSFSKTCQFSPPGTGLTFDLSKMQQLEHDYTGTTPGGYVYRFNACGNTVKVCNSVPAPASKWRGSKCNNLGDAETMRVSLLDKRVPSKGLKVSFDQGDICKKQGFDGQTEMSSRFVSYEVACSSQSPGELKEIKEVSMCEYTVVFESVHACPAGQAPGKFSNFALLCGFLFLSYCAGGYAYNKYYNSQGGMDPMDAIPHRAMWQELPGLVRDGVQFSYTQSKEVYETKLVPGLETLKEKAGPMMETLKDKLRGNVPGL